MKKLIIAALFLSSIFACYSDFDCGIGYKCVKAPFESEGTCMKSVDEYGIPQYNSSSTDSIGPKTEGGCEFDSDCPIGFRCDSYYKECVKQ
jgi:hypothetical protein